MSKTKSKKEPIVLGGSDSTFSNGNCKIMEIKTNGDFLVKGKLVKKDIEVYNAFVEFLKGTGYL